MKKADIVRLSAAYPYLWPYEMAVLPDGWTDIAERLLADLYAIQPQPEGVFGRLINLLVRSGNGFAIAYVSFSNDGEWDENKALKIVEAVQRFNAASGDTCEVCGDPSVMIVKEADGSRQQTLCQRHADERLAEFKGRTVQ